MADPVLIANVALAVIGLLKQKQLPTRDIPSTDLVSEVMKVLALNDILNIPDLKNIDDAAKRVLDAVRFVSSDIDGAVGGTLTSDIAKAILDLCHGNLATRSNPVTPSAIKPGVDFFYSVQGPLPVIDGDPDVALRLIQRAMMAWQLVAPIRMRLAHPGQEASANLVVTQRKLNEDPEVLAIATVGTGAGDFIKKELVFDQAESSWTVAQFFLTACHEFGHVLGLRHGGAESNDIMWHTLTRQLSNADAQGLKTDDDVLVKLVKGNDLFSENDKTRVRKLWPGTPPQVETVKALYDFRTVSVTVT